MPSNVGPPVGLTTLTRRICVLGHLLRASFPAGIPRQTVKPECFFISFNFDFERPISSNHQLANCPEVVRERELSERPSAHRTIEHAFVRRHTIRCETLPPPPD